MGLIQGVDLEAVEPQSAWSRSASEGSQTEPRSGSGPVHCRQLDLSLCHTHTHTCAHTHTHVHTHRDTHTHHMADSSLGPDPMILDLVEVLVPAPEALTTWLRMERIPRNPLSRLLREGHLATEAKSRSWWPR